MRPDLRVAVVAEWSEMLGIVGWILCGIAAGSLVLILLCAVVSLIESRWGRPAQPMGAHAGRRRAAQPYRVPPQGVRWSYLLTSTPLTYLRKIPARRMPKD